MRKFIKRILPLAIIYTVIFIIFFHGLGNYFLQDDFFNIYRGWTGSFTPYPYFAFRPIPYEIFGSFVFTILGMNPVLTHLILLIIHFFNVYLLWKLVGKFTKNIWIQFFTSFLYGTSSVHFGILFWLTANYILFGTTFLLLFLHVLFSYKSNPRTDKMMILIFLYLSMLLTNEAFSVFPIFLLFLSVYEKNTKRLLVPVTLLSGLSVGLRIISKAYSRGADYAIGSANEIIRTVWWYILRGINIVEGIRLMEKSQMQLFFLYLIILSVCLSLAFWVFLKTVKKPDGKIFLLGVIWFLLFGLPYFALVHHMSAYYLNTALIGPVIVISYIWLPIFSKKQKIYQFFIILFLSVYGLLSYLNVKFMQQTSWIVWRGNVARKYVQLVRQLYPVLPRGATLVFQKTSISHKEISLALYNDFAFKLIYRDPTLQVIYDETHVLMPNEYGVSEIDS